MDVRIDILWPLFLCTQWHANRHRLRPFYTSRENEFMFAYMETFLPKAYANHSFCINNAII